MYKYLFSIIIGIILFVYYNSINKFSIGIPFQIWFERQNYRPLLASPQYGRFNTQIIDTYDEATRQLPSNTGNFQFYIQQVYNDGIPYQIGNEEVINISGNYQGQYYNVLLPETLYNNPHIRDLLIDDESTTYGLPLENQNFLPRQCRILIDGQYYWVLQYDLPEPYARLYMDFYNDIINNANIEGGVVINRIPTNMRPSRVRSGNTNDTPQICNRGTRHRYRPQLENIPENTRVDYDALETNLRGGTDAPPNTPLPAATLINPNAELILFPEGEVNTGYQAPPNTPEITDTESDDESDDEFFNTWRSLDTTEIHAAEILGFNRELWNNDELPGNNRLQHYTYGELLSAARILNINPNLFEWYQQYRRTCGALRSV